MVFEGYLSLGGKEIVNAARTSSYVRNLASAMAPRDCYDCDEALATALGDGEYTTPEGDNAPWYDPSDPGTGDFYGFFPMSFDGATDSTRELDTVQRLGDGDVVLGGRHAGRDIRVQGWAFAKDKCSLEKGVSFLDNALRGTGDCFGDQAELFACCPTVPECATEQEENEFSSAFSSAFDGVQPGDCSTPLTPAQVVPSDWNTTSGTITQDGTTVVIDWEEDDPCMIAWTEITGMAPGEQYQLRTLLEAMDYHVRIGPDAPEGCRENLAPDPKATQWGVSTSAGAPDADNAFLSFEPGGPLGTGYRQAIYTQESQGDYLRMRDFADGRIPVVPGASYMVSGYMLRAFEGQTGRAGVFYWDEDGNNVPSPQSVEFTLEEGWDRHGIRVDIPDDFSVFEMEPWFLFNTPTPIPANSRIGVANVLVEPVTSTEASFGTWFDGDTDGYRWTGEPNDSPSEQNQRIDAETISGLFLAGRDYPFSPTVLDFSPSTASRYLWITPTAIYRRRNAGAGFNSELRIESMEVRKTARPGVIDFGTGDNMTPPSDGWTHFIEGEVGQWQVEWIPEGPDIDPYLITIARNIDTGPLNYEGDWGPNRDVFGLLPGSRYRVAIEVSAFGPGFTSLPIELSVTGGAAAQVEAYRDDSTTTEYIVVEFTASARSVNIALTVEDSAAPVVVEPTESVRWDIFEWMVEEILETDTTPPAVGLTDRRVMYDVAAASGPTLTSVRKTSCGVMGQVTFGIHAGDPYYYRLPRFVGGLPSGTSQIVPEQECSAEGVPVELNYMYNPSVENHLNGWTVTGFGATIERVLAPGQTQVGDYYALASAPDTAGDRLAGTFVDWVAPTTGRLPHEGQILTIAIGVFAASPAYEGTYTFNYSISSTLGADNASRQVEVPSDQWWIVWQRIAVPPGEIQAITLEIVTPDSITQGGGLALDGMAIMDGSYTPYPDENGVLRSLHWDNTTTGSRWTGATGDSALEYAAPAVQETVDPECPPIPEPPAPPMIPNSCVDDADAWNRTVFEISEDEIPRELTAFPIMTITTGATDVRQARIRFWPNPDNVAFDLIEPCDFEGDIVVSYIPANSVLTIDGVRRTATLTTPAGQEQVATHLLYATDGGPAIWPELSGGVAYYATLDTDIEEDFSDAVMTVELVVRD